MIILLGNGPGASTEAAGQITAETLLRSMVLGDFNSDGKADLVVTNVADNNIILLL